MNKSKFKRMTWMILCVYKIIYEYIYAMYVSPVFYSSKLVYTPNFEKAVISYIVFAGLLFIIPAKLKKPSDYLLNIFFVFTIIPILSQYWEANRATAYMLMCSASFFVLCMICKYSGKKKIFKFSIGVQINIVVILAIIIVSAIGIMTVKFGFADLRALNLYNVYEVRAERSYSGIDGYLINWLPYSLVPALICISVYKKKWNYTFLAIAAQLYLFLFTGSKTTLFSIGLILFSYWLSCKKRNFVFGWSASLTLLSIATTILYKGFGSLMPFGIFPVRLQTIPSSISFNHYDFFSSNPKLHLSETFIGRFFGMESPYNMQSTYLVSSGGGNANTGYLGDAFDNGGLVLMIIYSVILGMLLIYVDSLYAKCTREHLPVFVGLLTYTMIYLNDGSLTSALITGGLIINILILSVFVFSIISKERERDIEEKISYSL